MGGSIKYENDVICRRELSLNVFGMCHSCTKVTSLREREFADFPSALSREEEKLQGIETSRNVKCGREKYMKRDER